MHAPSGWPGEAEAGKPFIIYFCIFPFIFYCLWGDALMLHLPWSGDQLHGAGEGLGCLGWRACASWGCKAHEWAAQRELRWAVDNSCIHCLAGMSTLRLEIRLGTRADGMHAAACAHG